jgi:hypothetical protein
MKNSKKASKKNLIITDDGETLSSTLSDSINRRHNRLRDKNLKYGLERENLLLKNIPFKRYDIQSFDVETKGQGNYFYCMGFINHLGEYEIFYSQLDAINRLKSLKHNGVWTYATNLGFDFNALCEGNNLRVTSDVLMRGNQFICVKFDGSYHKIKLFDSVNYGGLSVEAMGKILGKQKAKKPRALGRDPKNNIEISELKSYNKRDCEITREFMLLFQEAVNTLGGELKSTISGCAMDIFRRKYLKHDVVRESIILGYDIRDKIFKAYYGGRTETFSRGVIGEVKKDNTYKSIYYGDINSLYPSVMLNAYPDPMSVNYKEDENRELLKFEGVSYFELQIPYTKYPLLPLKLNNKLVFPCGLLKGYYTHLEIRRAIELYGEKIIITMKDTVYYTLKRFYFKEYVETLYSLRKMYREEGNEGMSQCCKLLLNTLYGRFALRNNEKTQFFDFDDYEEALRIVKDAELHGKIVKVNSVHEAFVSEKEEYDGISSIPIWSVYVTAYARIKLHSLILQYEPYYVDTDSVITDKPVFDSKELGELKLEKRIKKGIIIKPKLYFLDDELKAKGVPIPKLQRDKDRVKKKILEGKEIKYIKFVKTKEGITRNLKINSLLLTKKKIALEDDKRKWEKPFNPEELQQSEPLTITESDYD